LVDFVLEKIFSRKGRGETKGSPPPFNYDLRPLFSMLPERATFYTLTVGLSHPVRDSNPLVTDSTLHYYCFLIDCLLWFLFLLSGQTLQDRGDVHLKDRQARPRQSAHGRPRHFHPEKVRGHLPINPQHGSAQHHQEGLSGNYKAKEMRMHL
jgi:hypothetical protein